MAYVPNGVNFLVICHLGPTDVDPLTDATSGMKLMEVARGPSLFPFYDKRDGHS